jgi:predicted metal-dependent hydrolase
MLPLISPSFSPDASSGAVSFGVCLWLADRQAGLSQSGCRPGLVTTKVDGSSVGIIEEQIRLGSHVVRYTVRRSDRARRMRLRIIPGKGLEVVLPRGFAMREAAAFVRRERDWVLRALDQIVVSDQVDLVDGAVVPFLGEILTLRLHNGSTNRVRRSGDMLLVARADGIPAPDLIESWCRKEARRVFRERALLHAGSLGVEIGRIAVKDTRSRWGSCSEKGNLNFSWRLMLAPFEVMDYVVAHEVAHLCELNHSSRFWSIVETICPDYRRHRLWLRRNGGMLAAWPTTSVSTI